MVQSFSQTPPVYSSPTVVTQTTPYPTNLSSMPMPMPMPMGTTSYANVYPPIERSNESRIPEDIYRESIRSAVLDKILKRYNEIVETKNGEINSLKKIEQDLNDGQTKIDLLINNIQQQQSIIKVSQNFLFFFLI
jgi:ESCRT-I complex subunit TSG101